MNENNSTLRLRIQIPKYAANQLQKLATKGVRDLRDLNIVSVQMGTEEPIEILPFIHRKRQSSPQPNKRSVSFSSALDNFTANSESPSNALPHTFFDEPLDRLLGDSSWQNKLISEGITPNQLSTDDTKDYSFDYCTSATSEFNEKKVCNSDGTVVIPNANCENFQGLGNQHGFTPPSKMPILRKKRVAKRKKDSNTPEVYTDPVHYEHIIDSLLKRVESGGDIQQQLYRSIIEDDDTEMLHTPKQNEEENTFSFNTTTTNLSVKSHDDFHTVDPSFSPHQQSSTIVTSTTPIGQWTELDQLISTRSSQSMIALDQNPFFTENKSDTTIKTSTVLSGVAGNADFEINKLLGSTMSAFECSDNNSIVIESGNVFLINQKQEDLVASTSSLFPSVGSSVKLQLNTSQANTAVPLVKTFGQSFEAKLASMHTDSSMQCTDNKEGPSEITSILLPSTGSQFVNSQYKNESESTMQGVLPFGLSSNSEASAYTFPSNYMFGFPQYASFSYSNSNSATNHNLISPKLTQQVTPNSTEEEVHPVSNQHVKKQQQPRRFEEELNEMKLSSEIRNLLKETVHEVHETLKQSDKSSNKIESSSRASTPANIQAEDDSSAKMDFSDVNQPPVVKQPDLIIKSTSDSVITSNTVVSTNEFLEINKKDEELPVQQTEESKNKSKDSKKFDIFSMIQDPKEKNLLMDKISENLSSLSKPGNQSANSLFQLPVPSTGMLMSSLMGPDFLMMQPPSAFNFSGVDVDMSEKSLKPIVPNDEKPIQNREVQVPLSIASQNQIFQQILEANSTFNQPNMGSNVSFDSLSMSQNYSSGKMVLQSLNSKNKKIKSSISKSESRLNPSSNKKKEKAKTESNRAKSPKDKVDTASRESVDSVIDIVLKSNPPSQSSITMNQLTHVDFEKMYQQTLLEAQQNQSSKVPIQAVPLLDHSYGQLGDPKEVEEKPSVTTTKDSSETQNDVGEDGLTKTCRNPTPEVLRRNDGLKAV